MKQERKETEIKRMYEIIVAAFEYIIIKCAKGEYKEAGHRLEEHCERVIEETKIMYKKKQAKKLEKWYRDTIEGAVHDESEVAYIKEKTGYDVNLLNELDKRIKEIIKRKKISNEDEYRDVMEMLCELNVKNQPKKMELLQSLIDDYDENTQG